MNRLRRIQKELHRNAPQQNGDSWHETNVARNAWTYRIPSDDDSNIWRVALWEGKRRRPFYNASRLVVYQVMGDWSEDTETLTQTVPQPSLQLQHSDSIRGLASMTTCIYNPNLAVWEGDDDKFRPLSAPKSRELFPVHESSEAFALEALYAGLSGAYPLRPATLPPMPEGTRLDI